jgi:hypothetical protein
MYKCPKCGGRIVACYLVPEIAAIYDIISKPNKKGFLYTEYLKNEYILKCQKEVFYVCDCENCHEDFPSDSLEEFGKKYAHLWVDGEE